jgi:hypothetical protein
MQRPPLWTAATPLIGESAKQCDAFILTNLAAMRCRGTPACDDRAHNITSAVCARTAEGGPTVVAADDAPNYARRLGIEKDQVVQELGWDEDTDDDIRADVEDACGGELLYEDADEVVDVVLLWWRDDDGDLVDRLMDAITPLADDGVIWVVTPKTGKPGHVQPAEIAESAPTAGLMQTSSANLGDWIASRLVQPKSKAAGRH